MPAKNTNMGMKGGMCNCPHHKTFGWIVLIVGILFLLRDFGVGGLFGLWNIQWWSVLFILVGLGAMCRCCEKGVCF